MEEREVVIEVYKVEKINWKKLFKTDNQKYELDVGSGKGEFLVEMAKRKPDVNFIGIEKTLGKCRKAFKKVKRENLANVKILLGRVEFIVPQYFEKEMFENIYINFPDPWLRFKRRSNRLLRQPGVVEDIIYHLKKGGNLYFITDITNYIKEAIRTFESLNLKLVEYMENKLPDYYPETEFYRKTREWGHPLYFAKFIKE